MMANERSPASFWTQADALLRKNLTYQKRHKRATCSLICFPILFCSMLYGIQKVPELGKESNELDCSRFTNLIQWQTCPIPSPPRWPPLLQVPSPENRAVRVGSFHLFTDLPESSCRQQGNCPVTTLITGDNQTLGLPLAGNMFNYPVLGSDSQPDMDFFLVSAFHDKGSLYNIQNKCRADSTISVSAPLPLSPFKFQKDTVCVPNLNLWRNSSFQINDQIYRHAKENAEQKYNEIFAAYDFLNTNSMNFNVNVWYNSTYKDSGALRLPSAVNLASNAYLQLFRGHGARVVLEFVQEMPRTAILGTEPDYASLISTLFYTWVVLQLFPVVLTLLVYEKQQKLRIMMKMHGLGDGPYWFISYMYFLGVSAIYIFFFVLFGSLIGLKFFTLNDYYIQFVFYFLYINLQISSAFLVSQFFSTIKSATVVGYLCAFASGLLGDFLFKFFVQDTYFPKEWIIFMQLYPGFALYRGLYEFGEYASRARIIDTYGMKWENLRDGANGMMDVMIIMLLEWLVVIFVAYFLDRSFSHGSGKHPNNLLQNILKKHPPSAQKRTLRELEAIIFPDQKNDIMQERDKVKLLMRDPKKTHGVVCNKLEKVYRGRGGDLDKPAVRELTLAIPHGECLGMLGPNGAGKTSFINMMIGLTEPTSGTAYVEGFNIRNQMDWVYTRIGVCPQHDLLWETLTGREHLLFYGRLKNLKGAALERAVEESLKSLNLLNGGDADKLAGKYSGGTKRRLSVAISLIGDPKVVFMDEPSTGLDPASKKNFWKVVKRAKKDRAIILTTNSLEEAEYLCDRVGIYVKGAMLCLGNPKELKSRVKQFYVLTVKTPINHEHEVEKMVHLLSPNAEKTYHLSGTQKFVMPKNEVSLADIFFALEVANINCPIYDWRVSDTTLEDIFTRITNMA